MIDVFASLPGRGPVEVERQVAAPLEKAFWSIPGVEYVYSTSSPGRAFLVVRFRVGEDPDRALVRVRAKLDALAGDWPPDLPPPLVKPRSIDDVPVWAMTFWSPTQDSATLRQIAAEVENEIKTIPEVSDTALIGGLRREFRVELDPARLVGPGPVARRDPRRARGREPAHGRGPARRRRPARSSSRRAASCAAPRSSVPSSLRRAAAARSAWPTSRASSTVPEEPVVLRDARRAGQRRADSRPSRSRSASGGAPTRSRSSTRSSGSSTASGRASSPRASARRSRATTARRRRRSPTSS